METLLYNGRLITPQGTRAGWLVWADGVITQLGNADEIPPACPHQIDADGQFVMPGFIDCHVHGALGYDTMDGDLNGLLHQAAFFAKHGVTSFLATTLTDTRAALNRALEVIAQAMHTSHQGAKVLGAYVEGPYLNAEKAGAQNPQHIRRYDAGEASTWLATGIVRVMTVAPEFAENDGLIRACARRRITISAAHTDATYLQMEYAIAQGVSQTTHTFNAMRAFHHREPGILGAALADDTVYCELIADNVHVHPAAMAMLWRVKGPERVILITDSTRATGMPDGQYDIAGQTFVMQNRQSRLSDGTLAGSTATMDQVVRNMALQQGGLQAIWQATSYNAACQIGVADRKGSLAVGKDADLVIVDEDIRVKMTIREGLIVYQRDPT
ncbi:MAG: N-acetylglucosamine-6-phosphate deacetylase [Anaerolineales bacterium]